MANIIWTPQPRQLEFMARREYEVLYGGAAGGGKSDALLAEALRQVAHPQYKGIILRKTYPQLSELIDRSRYLYGSSFPKAKYNGSAHCWTFPSGAKLYFGSMQHAKDRVNYQGKSYDFVGFDELTHFTWEEYSYLFSRNRPSASGTRVYLRATTNPGGVGHGWVKERFITAAPPMTPIAQEMDVDTPEGGKIKMMRKRVFVPSTVFDNPALLANNPDYLGSLSMMSEATKQALLYGSWDSFSGQVFLEWKNDPAHYNDQRFTHVIAPFRIPADFKMYRSFDFGYARPFSVGWYAVDHDGRIYRVKELYGCTSTPNEGVRWEPTRIAEEILQSEKDDPMLRGRQIVGVADPSIFDESRGESVAAMMERKRVYWSGADNTRMAGKMQFHNRLAFDQAGVPMFQVFSTCKHFIRTIPNLVYSDQKVEDVNSDMEDHIYDECRYLFMERPINPSRLERPILSGDDPLSLREGNEESYKFYRI